VTHQSVITETRDRVCTIILNRPERRNAVDRKTADALREAFERFEADDTLRVAVLHGAGGHFCAGADLKALDSPEDRNEVDECGEGPGPMGPTRMQLSKPVIAAVSGYAVAGGLELAAWCDLRVVEESAVFGVFCRRWGVPLIDGGTVRLPRIIGHGRAMDLILTGRPVDAREALAIGLANRVVEDGQAREAAEALAREIAAFPQQCLVADRRSAYRQWDLSLADALREEGAGGYPVVLAEALQGARRFAGGAGRREVVPGMQRKLISSGSTFEEQVGYSRAVVQGDWIFVSGTTGFDYATMSISPDVEAQARQCLENIDTALRQAGASLADVVRVEYILPRGSDFEKCWPVLREYFGSVRPAATMISANLMDPRMLIEIEVTAVRQA
jgi:enoyl-CoA hydratase